MAEIAFQLRPQQAEFDVDKTFPQFISSDGTNFSFGSLMFDAATDEECYFFIRAVDYFGTNSVKLDIDWHSDTATSGNVVWGAALAAVTPDDTLALTAEAFDTEVTITVAALGTTAGRMSRDTITITNPDLDGLAAEDFLIIRLRRLGTNGSDTLAGDAGVSFLTVRYDDS